MTLKILPTLLLLCFILTSCSNNCCTATDSIESKLISLNLEFKEIPTEPGFEKTFEIFIEQPLDHKNPEGEKFNQKIYLNHKDFTKPIIYETHGYEIRKTRHTELPGLFDCNELVVEHRYFGNSKPDQADYKYLTIEQAAADHHKIYKLFKNLYKHKWINTGISKGGQTTMYYNYFYPHDMDATVAYVGPLNLKSEDNRIHSFLQNVGSKECRDKVLNFQRSVLKNKKEIIPLLEAYAQQRNYTFPLGLEKTLEYAVLEYSFAFWQWATSSCDKIPVNENDPILLFDHLVSASPLSYFDGNNLERLAPFLYQAYTELGYYGYELKPFKDLLNSIDGDYTTSSVLFLKKDKLESNHNIMLKINEFIQNDATNMLFIYGEFDPWSATAIDLNGNSKCLKMVKAAGSHKTRIKHFDEVDKNIIYDQLEEWLDYQIPNRE